jgi:hypothetical protein
MFQSSCIPENRSSGFVRLPLSQNNHVAIIFNRKKTILNPVRCMNVWLGIVKPSWDQLCVQVDFLNHVNGVW